MGDAPTRGGGRLEGWLARQRAARAEKLIGAEGRDGVVVDIGCGTYPLFLSSTRFARRIGLDRHAGHVDTSALLDRGPIELFDFDIDHAERLPLDDAAADVVTMLAVFEHVRLDRMTWLLNEIYRVLKPGGRYVLTTPSAWSGPVLAVFKWLGLVSRDEIDEHTGSYGPRAIRRFLAETRFAGAPARFGHFECGMNVWGVVHRPGSPRL